MHAQEQGSNWDVRCLHHDMVQDMRCSRKRAFHWRAIEMDLPSDSGGVQGPVTSREIGQRKGRRGMGRDKVMTCRIIQGDVMTVLPTLAAPVTRGMLE